jgi:hypothetical protein
MLKSLPQTPPPSRVAALESQTPVYYIAWRIRQNHPWRSEEFTRRTLAYCRYFALLDRGVEAYLETRYVA